MASVGALSSLSVIFLFGCTSPTLSPDGGNASQDDGSLGRMDAIGDTGHVVVINAVPSCSADSKPSTLLSIDHILPPSLAGTSAGASPSSPEGDQLLPDFANALLIDDTGIYINAGLVLRSPLVGGRATQLGSGPALVSSFARIDPFLWAAANWGVPGLLQLPIDGTAPTFSPSLEGIRGVAGGGGFAFFTTDGNKTVASFGNDVVPGPTISLANSGTDRIAIVGSDVFVVTNRSGTTATSIERGSIEGGDATVIATSAGDIVGLAANSTFVYWVEATIGSASRIVRRASHDGAAQEIVASMNVSSLIVDDAAAYFAVDDGRILETATDTGTTTILAQGQVRPSAITQFGPRVYWINDRVASPASQPKANAVMTACK